MLAGEGDGDDSAGSRFAPASVRVVGHVAVVVPPSERTEAPRQPVGTRCTGARRLGDDRHDVRARLGRPSGWRETADRGRWPAAGYRARARGLSGSGWLAWPTGDRRKLW